jgi:hypothetical protein
MTIFGDVGLVESVNKLKEDLRVLCEWLDAWKMKFYPEKCKVLHFGANNLEEQYFIEGN